MISVVPPQGHQQTIWHHAKPSTRWKQRWGELLFAGISPWMG